MWNIVGDHCVRLYLNLVKLGRSVYTDPRGVIQAISEFRGRNSVVRGEVCNTPYF